MTRPLNRRTFIRNAAATATTALFSLPLKVLAASPKLTSYADRMGIFPGNDQAGYLSVTAKTLVPPMFEGDSAIWGAVGRDSRGHIWVGVSGEGNGQSAHLCEYNPATDEFIDRGDVLTELAKTRPLKIGEGQVKILSHIVQGEDGHLYFSSSDEAGEDSNGSALPTFGGHLWRYRIDEQRWEHLFAAPEALIAAAGNGQYIYVLGYWGHVVYQYDIRSGEKRRIRVGAVGGHACRNLFCDSNGHVYVPRMTIGSASLVEFDTRLKQVGETPLKYYTAKAHRSAHGIVAWQPLSNGQIAFLTDQGFLYLVMPAKTGAANVFPVGYMAGQKAYIANLFSSDNNSKLMSLNVYAAGNPQTADWVTFDIRKGKRRTRKVEMPSYKGQPTSEHLFYGSFAQDNQGRCYVVGRVRAGGRNRPVMLQLTSL